MSPAVGDPCPCCGARLGGRAGCQRAFETLMVHAWSSPARGRVHNLVVDAYAMQHSEEYCRSAKSYVAHLTALCCGLEAAGDSTLYWAIQRWLDSPSTLERPRDLSRRGVLTIADALDESDAYPDLVRQWAHDVWQAYSGHHVLARKWLEAVRDHLRRTA